MFAWVGLVLAGGMLPAYFYLTRPTVSVPAPANPSRLDPMLLNYVTQQVAWVRKAPRDPSRQATLGLVYAANGLWPDAQAAFTNVVRLEPDEPLGWLYLAVSFQELGHLDQAVARLRELTTRFADFAPGFARLGDYLLRQGAFEEAERAFDRLTKLAPREWRGFAGLGEVRLRKGDAAKAARFLEHALQLAPGAKPAHALLGQVYQRLGRATDAQRELALGLNAENYPMPDPWAAQAARHMRLMPDLLDIAQGDLRNGAPAHAAQVLEPALAFHPDDVNLLVTLAQAQTQSSQPQKAQVLIEHALRVNPSSAAAFAALSACDLILGRNEAALSNADRAILLSTNRLDGCVARANALLALERDNEAVAALEQAHRRDPKDVEILLNLGDLYLRNLNQPEQSLAAYRQAVALNPVLPIARVRLASLLLHLGDRAAALEQFEAARQIAPQDPGIAAALARLKPTPASKAPGTTAK